MQEADAVAEGRAAAVRAAYATLARGGRCIALGLRGGADDGAAAPLQARHARVVANGLRELDRFLHILIEDVAAFIGPDDFDPGSFARLKNAANKLGFITAAMGVDEIGGERLRAIGGLVACLFHSGGIVHRSTRDRIAVALDRPIGHAIAPGARLAISATDLREIGGFYTRIGAGLVLVSSAGGKIVDFPDIRVYIEDANVACDGI